LRERFNMLDDNGDGSVSLDEFRAGAQQLGDRFRNRQEGRPQPEERPDAPKRD
jgi:Ca2+-binding EF-hand superfamily protein